MIVCKCKHVDDDAVRRAIADGARTTYDVGRITGACRSCGSCAPAIVKLISKVSSAVATKKKKGP